MNKVIGLGKLGCAIADELAAYPEYRTYKINSSIEDGLSVGDYPGMAEYEASVDPEEVSYYFRSLKKGDRILFILEGGDPISGATLKILETIKDLRLNVLYICPDRQMVSETQKRDDRICFHVLQEYARSGKFENIFLVDKTKVEELAGDVPVTEYEKTISYFVSYVVAMINFFNHTTPILANRISPSEICRIVSYGVSSLDSGNTEVNLLFPLKKVKDIHFFYGVPEQDLKEDISLVKRIKEHVKGHQSEEVSTSFSVYETSLPNMIVLCAAYSPTVQDFAFK